MTRYWDRMLRRDAGFWEGMASGAAVLTTTYGQPDHEAVLPTLTRATYDAYGSNSPVFAAILVRLKLFSEARFCWQALDDKHLFGDTSLSVLEHPFGPGTNSGELLVRMQQDASLAGQAYIWAPPGEGRLVRKRPDWVTIISELVPTADGGWYRRKTGYWWEPPKDARGQGEGHFMDVGDVCHWAPIPDPLADFRGMSWLSPVLRDIQGDNGMAEYKIKYLANAATPNLLIKYAQKLAPGTVDRIRERVTARYGGVNNAFKTLLLDQGADATVVGANMQQLDFAGVTAAGVERILADSMVPPVLVGLEPLRGAGRGYQESLQKLANLWARPEWRSACGALEQIAPPPTPGVRLWFDDDDIAALQDGEMERGQTALVRSQAILTSRQAGATFDSAVAFVDSGDVTKLKFDTAMAVPAGNVQHLLPQPGQPGATAEPLPAGTQQRLPLGPASPGGGGQNTRPVPQLAAGRRSITAGANGDGDRPFVSRVGPHGYIHGWIHVGGSIDEHSPGGKLTPARQALHDRIIAGALAGTSPSAHPTATFMGGGPASGKSELLKKHPAEGVVIDPDAIKKQLPEYQAMLDAGDKSAAAYVHEESSKIAKDIMAAAVAGGRDFTLDGVGDGDYAKLAAKIEAARRAGYLVNGRYITVDTNTAVARAAKRGARTGRVVPETYLREAHAGVSAAFRQAVERDAFDTAELWDNNTTKELSAVGIKLVGSKAKGGTFKVTDPALWRRFLAKEHEQWNAAKQHT